MDKIKSLAFEFLRSANADAVAIATLDFKNQNYTCFEIFNQELNQKKPVVYFDLASLTKPLTNSWIALAKEIRDPQLTLMLNHQAGLPAWVILDKSRWKQQVLSYSIEKSETLYSDISALRFMLEVEKKYSIDYLGTLKNFWPEEIYFWKELPAEALCVQNGFYGQKANIGKVHDPNAFNIGEFTSHAGLFGTVEAVAQCLLKMELENNLLATMAKNPKQDRFYYGFDTVSGEESLAGKGCSPLTFGHLGFTGTSFWIDPLQMKGHVILSNSTKYYWFDKKELNRLRRAVGELIWQN